jgi:hypothetical protein
LVVANHELKRVERKYSVEKLPTTTVPFDVELRGGHDAKLLSSIENETRGWKHAHVAVSPRGDRFAIVGMNPQGNTLAVVGNRIYASDGSRALGGPQKDLIQTFPMAATAGATKMLVQRAATMQSIELVVLDSNATTRSPSSTSWTKRTRSSREHRRS